MPVGSITLYFDFSFMIILSLSLFTTQIEKCKTWGGKQGEQLLQCRSHQLATQFSNFDPSYFELNIYHVQQREYNLNIKNCTTLFQFLLPLPKILLDSSP